jgi:hypothetical protein
MHQTGLNFNNGLSGLQSPLNHSIMNNGNNNNNNGIPVSTATAGGNPKRKLYQNVMGMP